MLLQVFKTPEENPKLVNFFNAILITVFWYNTHSYQQNSFKLFITISVHDYNSYVNFLKIHNLFKVLSKIKTFWYIYNLFFVDSNIKVVI